MEDEETHVTPVGRVLRVEIRRFVRTEDGIIVVVDVPAELEDLIIPVPPSSPVTTDEDLDLLDVEDYSSDEEELIRKADARPAA